MNARDAAARGSRWALDWRGRLLAAALWIALPPFSAAATEATTLRAPLEPGLVAVLTERGELYLQALPTRGEARERFTRRLSDSPQAWEEISRANRGATRLLAGKRYLVPFGVLKRELQVRVVRELFPHDRAETSGWRHVAAVLGKGRTPELARISEWFTGAAEREGELRKRNALPPGPLKAGSEVFVPADLLTPPFRALLPAPPRNVAPSAAAAAVVPAESAAPSPRLTAVPGPLPSPSNVASATLPPPPAVPAQAEVSALAAPAAPVAPAENSAALLEFGTDDQGPYALYRLRPKEALYSAVVVRFTGQLQAEDVIALAGEIAARSGIADVTDIPVGYPVKIPRELLLPEFLPPDDPERRQYEAQLDETARYRNQVTAKVLEGITVILDAGHGGADVGASVDGTWESLYVFDIVQRAKAVLEQRTLAKVHVTTDAGDRVRAVDQDVLPPVRTHRVLTTPPYRIEESTVGVNLRWYLANSIFRKAVGAAGKDAKADERVVFVSVHADSLHPSLRGATVYIPAAEKTGGSFSKEGAVFSSRLEVREQPSVDFPRSDRVRSEGLSRQVGNRLVEAFRAAELAVHPYKPVRDRIIRNRRAWVPAVLRYNAIPAKVLLEVCNLANPEDRRLLRTRAFRQQVADALVSALLDYYGESKTSPQRGEGKASR